MQADRSKYHEARTWLTCTLAAAPAISSRARRKVLSPYLYPEEQGGHRDNGPDGGGGRCRRSQAADDSGRAQRVEDSAEGGGMGAAAAVSTFGPKEAQLAMIEILCEQRRAEVWGVLRVHSRSRSTPTHCATLSHTALYRQYGFGPTSNAPQPPSPAAHVKCLLSPPSIAHYNDPISPPSPTAPAGRRHCGRLPRSAPSVL